MHLGRVRMTDIPDWEKIADEHFASMSGLGWQDFAKSIYRREADGRAAGETDMFRTASGVGYEISDSYRWANVRGGDIIYEMALYAEEGAKTPTTSRKRIVKRADH
jgi:hypothetical protein